MPNTEYLTAELYALATTLREQPTRIFAIACETREYAQEMRFKWYNFKRSLSAQAIREPNSTELKSLKAACDGFELIVAPFNGGAEHSRGRYSGKRYRNLPHELHEAALGAARLDLVAQKGVILSETWLLFFRPRSQSEAAQFFGALSSGTSSVIETMAAEAEARFLKRLDAGVATAAVAETERPPAPHPPEAASHAQEGQDSELTQIARAIVEGRLRWSGAVPPELQAEIDKLKQEPK